MSREVEKFLESDLLERYLLETTTFEETQKVVHFIEKYPQVKSRYTELQENLEAYAASYAVKAPEQIRSHVMASIGKQKTGKTSWYFAAASIAALIFALSTFYFWDRSQTLGEQNASISNQIEQLEEDINTTKSELNAIQDEMAIIGNPETRRYTLNGNEKAAGLKALAYVNPEEKTSYINVINLPELPEDKCYQMWADIDGEMISMAILENTDNKLTALPYKENAASFNITIEPKGGNDHATVENLVANVFL